MSNRAVSATYRTVIDDVISNVRQDFEDMGIEREVLEELQRSWEAKIVGTGVADFDGAAPVQPASRKNGANGKAAKGESSGSSNAGAGSSTVKKEDDDEAALASATVKADPDQKSRKLARGEGSTDVSEGTAAKSEKNGNAQPDDDVGAEDKKRKRPASDDDEIGSDLDDSDDDVDGLDQDGNEDMILCLYDKVQRVRNKWKCVLRDGVASIDGRDYVFSKLASELEW